MIRFLKIVGLTFIFVGLLLTMLGLIVVGNHLPQERVYDCGMAEWHPDIPEQVRQECRKLRSSKIT